MSQNRRGGYNYDDRQLNNRRPSGYNTMYEGGGGCAPGYNYSAAYSQGSVPQQQQQQPSHTYTDQHRRDRHFGQERQYREQFGAGGGGAGGGGGGVFAGSGGQGRQSAYAERPYSSRASFPSPAFSTSFGSPFPDRGGFPFVPSAHEPPAKPQTVRTCGVVMWRDSSSCLSECLCEHSFLHPKCHFYVDGRTLMRDHSSARLDTLPPHAVAFEAGHKVELEFQWSPPPASASHDTTHYLIHVDAMAIDDASSQPVSAPRRAPIAIVSVEENQLRMAVNEFHDMVVVHPAVFRRSAIDDAMRRGEHTASSYEEDNAFSSLAFVARTLVADVAAAPRWIADKYQVRQSVKRMALSIAPNGETREGRGVVSKVSPNTYCVVRPVDDSHGSEVGPDGLFCPIMCLDNDIKSELTEGAVVSYTRCLELPGHQFKWKIVDIHNVEPGNPCLIDMDGVAATVREEAGGGGGEENTDSYISSSSGSLARVMTELSELVLDPALGGGGAGGGGGGGGLPSLGGEFRPQESPILVQAEARQVEQVRHFAPLDVSSFDAASLFANQDTVAETETDHVQQTSTVSSHSALSLSQRIGCCPDDVDPDEPIQRCVVPMRTATGEFMYGDEPHCHLVETHEEKLATAMAARAALAEKRKRKQERAERREERARRRAVEKGEGEEEEEQKERVPYLLDNLLSGRGHTFSLVDGSSTQMLSKKQMKEERKREGGGVGEVGVLQPKKHPGQKGQGGQAKSTGAAPVMEVDGIAMVDEDADMFALMGVKGGEITTRPESEKENVEEEQRGGGGGGGGGERKLRARDQPRHKGGWWFRRVDPRHEPVDVVVTEQQILQDTDNEEEEEEEGAMVAMPDQQREEERSVFLPVQTALKEERTALALAQCGQTAREEKTRDVLLAMEQNGQGERKQVDFFPPVEPALTTSAVEDLLGLDFSAPKSALETTLKTDDVFNSFFADLLKK